MTKVVRLKTRSQELKIKIELYKREIHALMVKQLDYEKSEGCDLEAEACKEIIEILFERMREHIIENERSQS